MEYANLVQKLGGTVHGCWFLIELTFLEGRSKIIKSVSNYSKLMNQAFDKYSSVYSELEKKFSDCKGVKFINLKNTFNGKKRDTYIDFIHYTPYGNFMIAKELLYFVYLVSGRPG